MAAGYAQQPSDIENAGLMSDDPESMKQREMRYQDDIEDGGATVVVVKWENYRLPIPVDHAVFMRKVFLTLCLQLLVTLGILALCVYVDSVRIWLLEINYFGFIMLGGMVCLLCALMLNVNNSPLNVILLCVFTVFMAFMVGTLCAAYATTFNAELVMQAFGVTTIIFVCLAAFASQTKCNLLPLGLLAFMLCNALFWWGMWALIFGWYDSSFYSLMFIIIFSLYILFDVWRMCNMPVFDKDAWIPAAINLYLDFINLFLWILRIMARNQ